MNPGSSSPSALLRSVTLLAFLALAAGLFAWSYGHWPDPQVDFGRELYVPWRLTEGDKLYVDQSWFNGPLSVHWNALWMGLLGVSLRNLALVNLALTLVTALLIHDLARRATDRWVAGACVFVFLTVFAFGQYAAIPNYNFICPYSHEITHGFLLGVASLACLVRARGERAGRWAPLWTTAAGLALGLCFLTKAEVFMAAAAADGLLLLGMLSAPSNAGRRLRLAASHCAGVVVPPLVCWLALTTYLDAADAFGGTIGSWRYIFAGEVRELPFYRAMMGTDRPWMHLSKALAWAAGYAVYAGLWAFAARRLPSALARDQRWRIAAFAAGFVVTGALLTVLHLNSAGRPYPFFLVALFLVGLPRLFTARRNEEVFVARALQLSVIAGAAVLTLKMILYLRLKHYGFVLALPATLAVISVLVGGLPAWLTRRGHAGSIVRAGALGSVLAFAGVHLYSSNNWFDVEGLELGWEDDWFYVNTFWRGPEYVEALDDLKERVQPGETLLVLPEGVMLNYLLRRVNPSRFYNFMPPEMMFFGEDTILDSFRADPPDYVVIAHKDTAEYGFPFFGQDYGVEIMRWVRRNYREKAVYGVTPLIAFNQIGLAIMERRTD